MEGAKDPKSFTLVELNEILRAKGLATKGSKNELISRLNLDDPSGAWVTMCINSDGACGEKSPHDSDDELASSDKDEMLRRREIEVCRREKEVLEKELELARREIQMLRRSADLQSDGQSTSSQSMQSLPIPQKVNVEAVADLLGNFSGNLEMYETWEKQVKFLKMTYKLEDDMTKIVVGKRLKEKAWEWFHFHSKPEYMHMTSDQLFAGLRGMFFHRPNKIALRRQFEDRVWKEDETFHSYVHEKVIMGNRIAINDDEIMGYIIDGIPDRNLRNMARVQAFTTKEQILQAFEEISLQDKGFAGTSTGSKNGDRSVARRKIDKNSKDDTGERSEKKDSYVKRDQGMSKRCFNCGMKDHRLLDTGSDITIMSANAYTKIGSPRLENDITPFRGIDTEENATMGRFHAKLTVDDHSYAISINVVSDVLTRYSLFIGKDFLDEIELNVKRRKATIKPLSEKDCSFAEICQIDVVCEQGTDRVDLANIQDDVHKQAIRDLIDNYKPRRTQDANVKMSLVLKDEEPVYQRARRLSAVEKDIINKQIEEWLNDGIVQPSVSEYASPVVLVKKKDGSNRLCIDFRLLNKKIVKDRYPLPLIEDQLDALQSARVSSTLDLKNGFFHVPIEESSRKYTAFIVPDGHYEFLRVPFGLCNSPTIFQKFINAVFQDLIREHVLLVYIDDLIIPSVDLKRD
nr:PREDICTED: uncharacterized protein LOC105663851 [Megachile rotundata]